MSEKKRHKPCLILNQDYRPLLVISWRRAMCLQIIGKEMPGEGIRVLSYYEDDVITSAGGDFFPVAAVAVTNRFIKRRRKIALKKRSLLVRDHRKCQYCGKEVRPQNATIDHIIPRSRYKDEKEAHTWENTVIACVKCNLSKDNNTPEEAGMTLLSKPTEPDLATFYTGLSPWSTMPQEWEAYAPTKKV